MLLRHLSLWRRSRTFGDRLLLWMLHGSRSLLLCWLLRCLPLRSGLRMLLRHLPLFWCGTGVLLWRLRLGCWLRTHRLLHRCRMLLLLRRRLPLSLQRLGIPSWLTRPRRRLIYPGLWLGRWLRTHRLLHRRRMLLLLGRWLLLTRYRLRIHAWLTWPRHGLPRRLVYPGLRLSRWL
jgi:hypothetical protein